MSSRKITDLERLNQPGGKVLPDDESIPVLTERLSLPSLELDTSLPAGAEATHAADTADTADRADAADAADAMDATEPAESPDEPAAASAEAFGDEAAPPVTVFPAAGSASAAVETPALTPVDASAPAKEIEADASIDWTQVEEAARDALLHELQSRLSTEIDRQLRERLQPTVVRMLLATVTELRPSIEAAVRESVARVVAAEVARRRAGD